jgi:G6PDH family F420-dependent oxidoreductase
MSEIGYFLSSEEHGPRALLEFARMGEQAGFRSVLISDHFHPWTDRQGQSPFVWGVIGAIAGATRLHVTTGVTCPTVRTHPAIIAQAAATSSLLLDGRFALGVGTGENLNEHILGDRWPPAATRLEMLEEAVDVIRQLWSGDWVTHHGRHYTVENARIYSCPDEPPPVYISAFGPNALSLAASIADGYVNTQPDPESVKGFRQAGGRGPSVGAVKVCWGPDEKKALRLAHEVWATTGVPGELNQELPMPAHFEQATRTVTEEMIAEVTPCGPDPERHRKAISEYLDAGYDKVYVSQIGDDQAGFLEFYFKEVAPRLER